MDQVITGMVVAFLIILLCTAGCSTRTPPINNSAQGPHTTTVPPARTEPTLEGMTWYLVVVHTASGRANGLVPGSEITVFLEGNGKITGSAGCNHYTASYSVSSNSLSIGSPAATKMYCASPEGTMVQEATYLSMLKRVQHFQIGDGLLTFADKDETPLLAFSTIQPAGF